MFHWMIFFIFTLSFSLTASEQSTSTLTESEAKKFIADHKMQQGPMVIKAPNGNGDVIIEMPSVDSVKQTSTQSWGEWLISPFYWALEKATPYQVFSYYDGEDQLLKLFRQYGVSPKAIITKKLHAMLQADNLDEKYLLDDEGDLAHLLWASADLSSFIRSHRTGLGRLFANLVDNDKKTYHKVVISGVTVVFTITTVAGYAALVYWFEPNEGGSPSNYCAHYPGFYLCSLGATIWNGSVAALQFFITTMTSYHLGKVLFQLDTAEATCMDQISSAMGNAAGLLDWWLTLKEKAEKNKNDIRHFFYLDRFLRNMASLGDKSLSTLENELEHTWTAKYLSKRFEGPNFKFVDSQADGGKLSFAGEITEFWKWMKWSLDNGKSPLSLSWEEREQLNSDGFDKRFHKTVIGWFETGSGAGSKPVHSGIDAVKTLIKKLPPVPVTVPAADISVPVPEEVKEEVKKEIKEEEQGSETLPKKKKKRRKNKNKKKGKKKDIEEGASISGSSETVEEEKDIEQGASISGSSETVEEEKDIEQGVLGSSSHESSGE